MTRKSPIQHTVKSHTRRGKQIQSFERGKGRRSQRSRKVVGYSSKLRDLPKIGSMVSSQSSTFGFGLVHVIISSPEELKKDYPKDDKWLRYIALEYEGLSMDQWRDKFPLILVDMGGGAARRFYYIYKSNVPDYKFSDVSYEEAYRNLLTKIRRKDKEIKFIVHRTRRQYLEPILRSGIKPMVKTGFRELEGQVYSMGVGNTTKVFSEFESVGGEPGDVYIIYRKTDQKPLLLETEMNPRLLGISSGIDNWYISRKVVKPEDIQVVYDTKGSVIYKHDKKMEENK